MTVTIRLSLDKFALLVLSATLSACGGGGGGSSSPPAGPATITMDNAEIITREVLEAGLGAGAFGVVVGGGGILSADSGPNSLTLDPTIGPPTTLAREWRLMQGVQTSVTIPPETFACDVSGTVRLSGTLASTENLTAGDRINATFNDCDDAEGVIYEGGLRIDVTAFSGNILSDQFLLGARVTLDDLEITEDGHVTTGDGGFDLDLDLTVPLKSELTIDGERLDVSSGSDSWVLRDFAVTVAEDATGVEVVNEYSGVGTLEGSGFEGAVDFVTVVPLVATGGDYPATGEVLIHGAGGATIRATVLDATSVQLAIDLDGDDVVDDTPTMSWSNLQGGLGSVLYGWYPLVPQPVVPEVP